MGGEPTANYHRDQSKTGKFEVHAAVLPPKPPQRSKRNQRSMGRVGPAGHDRLLLKLFETYFTQERLHAQIPSLHKRLQ